MTESALSIRAYAKHRRREGLRGHTPGAVQKALKTGRIRKTPEGKIDPAQADAEWEGRSSPARRPFRGPEETGPQIAGPEYAQARAVRELYAARLARLEFEERSGTLVSADEVKVAAFNAARKARDLLLALPDRLAPVVAGLDDPLECHRVMSEEIRRICDELNGQ